MLFLWVTLYKRHTHRYIHKWSIGIMVRVFISGPWAWGFNLRSSYNMTLKTVLDASLLNTQHDMVQIKGKWSNPGKGVSPSPIHWCHRYWKVSLQVAFDYSWPTYYFLLFTLYNTYIHTHCYIYDWRVVNISDRAYISKKVVSARNWQSPSTTDSMSMLT